MSYDLVFWKQEPGFDLDPIAVCEAFAEARPITGLIELPIDRVEGTAASLGPLAIEPVLR